MTKPSIFRYEGHNYLVSFLIISSLFFMWGFAHGILEVLNPHFQESFHISKAMSALTHAWKNQRGKKTLLSLTLV